MGMLTNAMTAVFGTPPPAPLPGISGVSPMQPAVVVPNSPPPGNVIPGTNITTPANASGITDPSSPPAPPLHDFQKVWENKIPDPNAQNPNASFLDNVNPESVGKAAASVNFASAIKPEILEMIAKGGQEGLKGFTEAMNIVAQEVYAKSALAGSAITKKALEEQADRFQKKLPDLIRDNNIRGSTKTKNSAYDNPALKPLVGIMEQQIAKQYPAASPSEVAEMVNNYFTGVRDSLAPPTKNNTKTNDGEPDWDTFI